MFSQKTPVTCLEGKKSNTSYTSRDQGTHNAIFN